MADIDYDRLSEAIVEALNRGAPGSDATRTAEEFRARQKSIEALMKQTKEIKENYGVMNTFGRAFLGQKAGYADVKKTLEDLDRQLKSTTNLDERTALIKRRRAVEEAAAQQNVSAAFTNTGIAVTKFASDLTQTVFRAGTDILRSVQTGGNSVNIAGNVLKTGAELVKTGAVAAGDGLQGLGAAALMSKNLILKGLGVTSVIAGAIIKTVGQAGAEIVKFGIDLIGTELNKTIDSYNMAASAGALFANGMTEMRNAASMAGMSVVTLGNIVKNSSDALYASGMNIGAATKKITETFAGAEGRKLKRELFNLGYTLEEQGQLVAESMKYMSIAGVNVKNLTGAEIGQATEKYATNLKAIAAITGEDAKRKLEETRQLAANAAVQSALAQMDTKAREQFLLDLTTVPKDLQRAVLQQRILGTVVDKNAAVMSGVVPGFAGNIRDFANGLGQGEKVMGQYREQAAETMRQAHKNRILEAIGVVGLVSTLGGTASEVSEFQNRLTLEYQKGAKQVGDTTTALEALEQMKNTVDPLTVSMSDLQILSGELAATLESEVTPYLSLFGNLLQQVNEKMIEAIRKAGEYLREKLADNANDQPKPGTSLLERGKSAIANAGTGFLLGGAAGALLGIPFGPAGMLAGAKGGAAIGTAMGGVYGAVKPEYDEYIAKPISSLVDSIKSWFSSNTARNARGGITQAGKLNIAGEAGPEAIVPLETGSIPVTIKTEGLSSPISADFMSDLVEAYSGLLTTTTDLQSAISDSSMSIGEMADALASFKDIKSVFDNFGNLDQSILQLAKTLDSLNLTTVQSLKDTAQLTDNRRGFDVDNNQIESVSKVLERLARGANATEIAARSTTSLIDTPKILLDLQSVDGERTDTLAGQNERLTQNLQVQLSGLINELKTSAETVVAKPSQPEPTAVANLNENLVNMLKNTLVQGNEALKSVLQEQNEILRTNTSRIEDLASATNYGADYTRRLYNEST